ncbi:hypothetical protein U1Q18_001062 [Sarracenia purpurea var. burkii]
MKIKGSYAAFHLRDSTPAVDESRHPATSHRRPSVVTDEFVPALVASSLLSGPLFFLSLSLSLHLIASSRENAQQLGRLNIHCRSSTVAAVDCGFLATTDCGFQIPTQVRLFLF